MLESFIHICYTHHWWGKTDSTAVLVILPLLVLSFWSWCTLWRIWESCAMALLCSSSVSNRCHLLEIWNKFTYWMAVTLTSLLFLSCPGVIAFFSVPLFYKRHQVRTLLIYNLSWSLLSYPLTHFFGISVIFFRNRWTASLQKSRPTLITSRTCEYGAILWHNVAISRGQLWFYCWGH